MVSKTKERAKKGRITKLAKKSSSELINIILKKDDVERNLNGQIIRLKGEVNDCTVTIKNLKSDIDGTQMTIDRLNEEHKSSVKAIENKNIEYNQICDLYNQEQIKSKNLARRVNICEWIILLSVVIVFYMLFFS